MRHRALGAITLILLVTGQSAVTCHDAPPASRQTATVSGLIAASLCSTSLTRDRAPTPQTPISRDPSSPSGVGCLHCAGSGCATTAGAMKGGWLVTFGLLAAATGRPTDQGGKSGAPAWFSGHPVRGPPSTGV